MKMKDGIIYFMVIGQLLDDLVILKSENFPAYCYFTLPTFGTYNHNKLLV